MPLLGLLGLMPLRGRSGRVLYELRVSLRRRLREGLHAGESGSGDKGKFEGFIHIHHLAQRGGERFVFDRKNMPPLVFCETVHGFDRVPS
jgi:hypothetical protein